MRTVRHLVAFAAAALVGTTITAATTHAQTPGGYYVAVPVTPPAKRVLITRTTAWDAQGASYVAARSPARDNVLCEMVVKNAGPLTSFTVAGQAYDADALAKCNAKAKGGAGGAAAVAAR